MENQADTTFTVEMGLNVQNTDLAFWKTVLKDEVYTDLETWAKSNNIIAKDGYGIRRGDALKYHVLGYEKFKIHNNVEDIILFESDDELAFIHFVREIATENNDEEMNILCKSDAKKYIEIYCDNLDLIK